MPMTCWWWIRHAPVTTDGGRIYGQTDAIADVTDKTAFRALAAHLPHDAVWVTSHLSRTRDTATAISATGFTVPELLTEPDFAEQNFGEWQGQPRAQIYQQYADWPKFWLAPADATPPKGESFRAVVSRVGQGIERMNSSNGGRDIVAVAHGGTIRAALAIALGVDPAAALAFTIDNLSLTRLDHISRTHATDDRDAWRIVAVNLPPEGKRDSLATSIIA